MKKAKSLLEAMGRVSIIIEVVRTVRAIVCDLLGYDIDQCQGCGARNFVTIQLYKDFNPVLQNITWYPERAPPDWAIRQARLHSSRFIR